MPPGRATRHHVVAVMLVRAGTVLLCHRCIDRDWYPGAWDLPGGHVEANETPQDAVVREVREELGLTLSGSLGHHSFSRTTEEYALRVWIVRTWSGSPTNRAPHEHDEIRWVTAHEAASLHLVDDALGAWILQALASE